MNSAPQKIFWLCDVIIRLWQNRLCHIDYVRNAFDYMKKVTPGSLGSNRLTKSSNRYPPAKSRMSYHFSFSCIETYMNYARTIKVGCWLFFSGILPPSRRTTARRPPRHRRRSTSTPINYQPASLARCHCLHGSEGHPHWGGVITLRKAKFIFKYSILVAAWLSPN